MPEKAWTSEADFEAWVWTDADTDTTPGSVLIAVGEAMAEGLSPVYECASYRNHARCLLAGNAPTGTNILVRYRIGATELACTEADWSPWYNGLSGESTASVDLLVDLLNRAVDATGLAFVQYQVRLYSE
jgi:hypothetical protein